MGSLKTRDSLATMGIHSITGGLNYYIHGDAIKLMANYGTPGPISAPRILSLAMTSSMKSSCACR